MTDTPEQTKPGDPATDDAEHYLGLVLSSLSTTLRGLLRIVYAGGRTAVLAELAAGRTLTEAKAATDAAARTVYTPPPEPTRTPRAAMATQAPVIR